MGDAIKSKKKKYKKKVYNQKNIEKISKLIKDITDINPFENTRKQEIIEIRSLLIYVMREVEGMTYEAIKNFFIRKGRQMDHATALHSYRNFPLYCRYNKKIEFYYHQILDKFGTGEARKAQAKSIIEKADPAEVELFIYMYEKTTESI